MTDSVGSTRLVFQAVFSSQKWSTIVFKYLVIDGV